MYTLFVTLRVGYVDPSIMTFQSVSLDYLLSLKHIFFYCFYFALIVAFDIPDCLPLSIVRLKQSSYQYIEISHPLSGIIVTLNVILRQFIHVLTLQPLYYHS
jgi:hypothetical protein